MDVILEVLIDNTEGASKGIIRATTPVAPNHFRALNLDDEADLAAYEEALRILHESEQES